MSFIKFKPLTAEMQFKTMITKEQIPDDLKIFLEKDEEVIYAFQAVRDIAIATNKRLIVYDFKGIRGFRREIYSIFYSSITASSIDIHNFDTTVTLTSDSGYQVILNFYKPITLEEMYNIYNYINHQIMKKDK